MRPAVKCDVIKAGELSVVVVDGRITCHFSSFKAVVEKDSSSKHIFS